MSPTTELFLAALAGGAVGFALATAIAVHVFNKSRQENAALFRHLLASYERRANFAGLAKDIKRAIEIWERP